jgi:hypothetical protein
MSLTYGVLVAIVLLAIYNMYQGIQAKEKAKKESNYLNGAFYINYPPDPYPNFPGSNI